MEDKVNDMMLRLEVKKKKGRLLNTAVSSRLSLCVLKKGFDASQIKSSQVR